MNLNLTNLLQTKLPKKRRERRVPPFISHTGVVVKIKPAGDVEVQVQPDSACGSCAVRSSCALVGSSARTIKIAVTNPHSYALGQQVNVIMQQKSGYWAVFYAYVLPLILVLSTLILGSFFNINELTAGISSIIILIPYYFLLWYLRKYFLQKFDFKIAPK